MSLATSSHVSASSRNSFVAMKSLSFSASSRYLIAWVSQIIRVLKRSVFSSLVVAVRTKHQVTHRLKTDAPRAIRRAPMTAIRCRVTACFIARAAPVMTCALSARSRPTASSRPPEVRLTHSLELSRHRPSARSICRPIPSLCDSDHIYRFSALTSSKGRFTRTFKSSLYCGW